MFTRADPGLLIWGDCTSKAKRGVKMSTQTCPQCNAEIVGRFHFCLECGAPLELAKSLTPPPALSTPTDEDHSPQPVVMSGVAEVNAPSLIKSHKPTPAPFQLDEDELEEVDEHANEQSALEALNIPKLLESKEEEERVALQKSTIKYLDLALIRSPDLDSVRFVVKDHSIIGREEGHLIFKDDPYISPVHATLYYTNGSLFIRDEDSYNGVYIRLFEPKALSIGENFIAGEQMFILESEPQPMAVPAVKSETNTRFFANSAKNTLGYYLNQTLDGGQLGAVYPFTETSITIGRQGCDVNAPLDRFMSSRHCHVSLIEDQVILTDTGSKNGTFVKVQGEQELKEGDYILLGKQLLQVQPHQSGSRSKVSI